MKSYRTSVLGILFLSKQVVLGSGEMSGIVAKRVMEKLEWCIPR